MISFLNRNDLFGLFIILIVFLSIKGILLFFPYEITFTDLRWMLLGERMSEGSQIYTDIYTDLPAFSSFFAWLIYEISGRSYITLQICNTIVTFVSVYFMYRVTFYTNAFTSKNQFPIFIFLVFSLLTYDHISFNEVTLALPFILAFIYYILTCTDVKDPSQHVFLSGFWLGLATLAHKPSFVFLFLSLYYVAIYAKANATDLLLLIIGFLAPLLMVSIYFYFDGSLHSYIYHFVTDISLKLPGTHSDVIILLFMTAMPFILFFFSLINSAAQRMYNIFQGQTRLFFFLFFIFGVFSYFFQEQFYLYHLLIITPAIVYFVSLFIMNMRNLLYANLLIGSLLFSSFAMIILPAFSISVYGIQFGKNHIKNIPLTHKHRNTYVLDLNGASPIYLYNKHATPFFDQYSIDQLKEQKMDELTVAATFLEFENAPADIVIDRDIIFYSLMKNSLFQKRYKIIDSNVYKRVR